MVRNSKVASGRFIDEVIGLDAYKNAVDTAVFNYLYQAPTKIPQTNDGVTGIVSVIDTVNEQFVVNGFLAPGNVTIDNTTVFLEKGYQTTAQRVESQSQADREARKCPPIATVIKGAGAIHIVDINANFVR
jgi:hypothetical protein